MRLPHPRLVALANAILVAGLVIASLLFARQTLRYFMGDKPALDAGTEAPQRRDASRAKPIEQYSRLLEHNIFGHRPGRLVPLSKGVSASTAEGRGRGAGNVSLAGTVAWADGSGYAFISDSSGGQEVYRKGDLIPGSGRLKRIKPLSIIVESGGVETEVPLSDIADIVEVSGPSASAAQPGGLARQTADDTYLVNKNAIEESLANPKRMLTDARLLPNMVEGVQVGFVMSEVRPGGLYDTLGLKNGDVLLRVNDFDISSAESGLQAFTALRGMEKIDLDVMRDGQRMTLTYLIR